MDSRRSKRLCVWVRFRDLVAQKSRLVSEVSKVSTKVQLLPSWKQLERGEIFSSFFRLLYFDRSTSPLESLVSLA